MHYAKQGPGRQSRQAEMRCQHCTGALMYECGEIKRVTRQTGGGWKGESSVPVESSCTSASRCFLPSPPIPPSVYGIGFCSFIYLAAPPPLHLQILCHGGGHNSNKVERSQRGCLRKKRKKKQLLRKY